MAGIRLESVNKIYPNGFHAVKDVSLVCADHEFLVLLGPSGCGKTSLLRMIAGLEAINSGKVYIGDQLVNEVEAKDRDVAMVFQNYALYPHMTVFGNLAFALKLRKIAKQDIKQRVIKAARMLDIEDLLTKRPRQLSGGQMQRVALGRAIVREPRLFLMDEPLSNLDMQLRVQMRLELIRMHQTLGGTFIYVTHDQMEAMTMGSTVVVMKDGTIQQAGSPLSVYENPNNTFVAQFIGSPAMNLLEGQLVSSAGRLAVDLGNRQLSIPKNRVTSTLTDQIGKTVILGIRPEDIRCCAAIEVPDPEGLLARIDRIEAVGAESYIHISWGRHRLVARTPRGLAPPSQAMTCLRLDENRIHLFSADSQESILQPVREPAGCSLP